MACGAWLVATLIQCFILVSSSSPDAVISSSQSTNTTSTILPFSQLDIPYDCHHDFNKDSIHHVVFASREWLRNTFHS